MTERDITGHIAVLASVINMKRVLSNDEMQTLAVSALKLLEGLLIDIHTIAEATAEICVQNARRP